MRLTPEAIPRARQVTSTTGSWRGTIARQGIAPALNQIFKEATDLCISSYRRSIEPTTGLELTTSEIGIAQIQDMTVKRGTYSPSIHSFPLSIEPLAS